ncbi:MAG: marine proteobacterial sortase target protein [Xanthobacteraceae bacterium]|jgi:Ca-activated chloride channel family protein|nr:marine proteobacterial sortase target protein [Xanthobacteraceae bacterium]
MSTTITLAQPARSSFQKSANFRKFIGRTLRIAALAIAATALVVAPAFGEELALRPASTGEMQSGALLMKRDGQETMFEAMRLGTDVDITVSGPTARARITQIFRNDGKDWVEGTYVYPLPEGGAVDTLKMVVGERVIVGEIKEKQKARAIYEQAKSEGRKAGLVAQERPNVFTTSVANIGPGETVVVQIEYQEPVRQDGDTFSLRVPLVVAPRYSPPALVQQVDLPTQGKGWGHLSASPTMDAPVLDPDQHGKVNPVTIAVKLQAGFPLDEVKSAYHIVKVESQDAGTPADTRLVKLDGPVPADRDFQLSWTAKTGAAPSVGLFRERVGNDDYLLAFVTPPTAAQPAAALPREMIFVIDNSGSMGGTSMRQAKEGLTYGLSRLKPGDSFNVIRFDDTMETLFPDTVTADAGNVAVAQRFVAGLDARGGTEMLAPMKAALTDPRANEGTRLRQVVFLTDGAVENEQQLFDAISALRGKSRLFMVAIGSAPNSFLMTRAAELGRGSFVHIGDVAEVEERMRTLFAKLESPAVTGLAASFSAAKADVTPAPLPDLYKGEPLVMAAKIDKLAGDVTLRGRIGDQPWSVTLPLASAAEGAGLSKLWARRKIDDAEVAKTLSHITAEQVDARVLDLGLAHHLVTRLTSLVAVDQTVSRPAGEKLTRADVPLNLPAGWEFDRVFGESAKAVPPRLAPDNAMPPSRRASAGTAPAFAKLAAAPVAISTPAQTVDLPQTATDAELRLMAGLMLLALATLMLLLSGRREWLRA